MTPAAPDPTALALLRRVDLFREVPETDLRPLAATMRARDLPHGETLFRQGDPVDGLWMVERGALEVRVTGRTGATRVISTIGERQVLGEIALLDGGTRSADAVAAGATRAHLLPRGPALDLLLQRPEAMLAVLRMLCARLRASSTRMQEDGDAMAEAAQRHIAALQQAYDANPLTRLPGGPAVGAALEWLGRPAPQPRFVCHLDFDHFRPFNDTLGTLTGDAAIRLFGAMLSRRFPADAATVVGHVGGDDFFAGFTGRDGAALEAELAALLRDFREECQGFYPPEALAAGRMRGRDREGREREFPLLACSAGILEIPPGAGPFAPAALTEAAMELRTHAKTRPHGVARGVYTPAAAGWSAVLPPTPDAAYLP